MGEIKEGKPNKMECEIFVCTLFGVQCGQPLMGTVGLGFDALVPQSHLSLSLSPSHTTTFSFNVRVGFLSYLPNWNLLSGSGGGW